MRYSWGGALLALLLLSAPAQAAPEKQAEDAAALFARARARHAGAEFEEAIRLLLRARESTRDPELRCQIELQLALNHEVLGRPEQARAHLRAALELDPLRKLDPRQFKASIIALHAEVRGSLRGRIEVSCEGRPCGAVLIDGVEVGRGPWRGELRIGDHRLEVLSADGRARHAQRLLLGPGRSLRVSARFAPPRGSLSVRSTPEGAAVLLDGREIGRTPLRRGGIAVGAHVVTLRREGLLERTVPVEIADGGERQLDIWLPSPARPSVPEPRRRRWTWVAGGAAVVALGVGAGLGISARSTHQSWEETRAAGVDPIAWEELRSSGERKQLAANILLATGGVLAATGVVLFVLEGRRAAVQKLEVSTRGGGLQLRGSF